MLALLVLLQGAGTTHYWQQRLDYTISASLDEPQGTLRGTQRVGYHNNSPDTLTTVSFHLYLNAFRPGSRWADADSVERRRRFNDLKDPDFGRNAIANVRVMGESAEPIYPFAPDSTIARFVLPRPLPPGDSMTIEMEWLARPSTIPRRQGRQGRAYDFAQWYPRVVAYDKHGWQEHPLYPAGEFYGDFGDFTVVLDLPEDQVVGATGVALCGDPGWEAANRTPNRRVEYGRDRYPKALSALASDACAPRATGRKTIVWRAEEVHHFALSMRPDYRYEGGRWGDVDVHVLYRPGDETSWGGGIAVRRTEVALEWLDGLFGRYPWPQITNVHRIEGGGGTEFPMMLQDGDASQGLILHELGHNYLMGILANNEWREGFLDEGFTSFQTRWFFESQEGEQGYRRIEAAILAMDLDGISEPVSLVSEHYRDFGTYGMMIYVKGELFFHQLRAIVGDEAMRRILRAYYQRWRLKHVDEDAFRAVAEEVAGRDLRTFFGQWLHGTGLSDYAVGRVTVEDGRTERREDGRTERRKDGRWITRVEVKRESPGVFPVDVVVRSPTDSAIVRVDGAKEREWVELFTMGRPREVEIDPRGRAHDWYQLDNRKRRGFLGWRRAARRDLHLDRIFSTRTHRDRRSVAILPAGWYSDAGGATVGFRTRANYFGRLDKLTGELSLATRRCCPSADDAVGWYLRLEDPAWLYAPRVNTRFEAHRFEGRAGALASIEKRKRGHLGFGPTTSGGLSLRWLGTYDIEYLDPALWENAGSIELTAFGRSTEQRGRWSVAGEAALALGAEYRNRGDGPDTEDRYDGQGYLRATVEGSAKRALGNWGVSIRAFGGWLEGSATVPVRQRWFYLAGGDPFQQLTNPLVRSAGAILTDEVHWLTPGGGGLRGFERDVAVTAIGALTVELDRSVLRRPSAKLFREVRLAAFGDLAASDGFFSTAGATRLAGDLGLGVRMAHTIGETSFTTRFDIPLLVSHPDRAIGGRAGDSALGVRWVVGVGR
jgi:hypothetical protein